MKSLLLIANLFLISASSLAAENLQPNKHQLWQYEGFWRTTSSSQPEVVWIKTLVDYKTKKLFTQAHGIDLWPDFGYLTLISEGSGWLLDSPRETNSGDFVDVNFNPDRKTIEGLLEKTINNKKQLFEFTFNLISDDVLEIRIRTMKKTVLKRYSRALDSRKAIADMENIFIPRTMQLKTADYTSTDISQCKWDGRATYPAPLNYAIGGKDFFCVKHYFDKYNPQKSFSEELFAEAMIYGSQTAITYGNYEAVPFFHSKFPRNLRTFHAFDEDLKKTLLATGSRIGYLGEHGNVPVILSQNLIMSETELLKFDDWCTLGQPGDEVYVNHCKKRLKEVRHEAVMKHLWLGNAANLLTVLTYLPIQWKIPRNQFGEIQYHEHPLSALLYNFSRWEQDGHKVFEVVWNSQPQPCKQEYILWTSIVKNTATDATVRELSLLAKCSNLAHPSFALTDTQDELASYKKKLIDPDYQTYTMQMSLIKGIERLEENIQFLQALPK